MAVLPRRSSGASPSLCARQRPLCRSLCRSLSVACSHALPPHLSLTPLCAILSRASLHHSSRVCVSCAMRAVWRQLAARQVLRPDVDDRKAARGASHHPAAALCVVTCRRHSRCTVLPWLIEQGYGLPVNTTIDPTPRRLSTILRSTFTMPANATRGSFNVTLAVDDGALIYWNNIEVFRFNMAPAANTTTFPAGTKIDAPARMTFVLPVTAAIAGVNTVAVSVHQESTFSADMFFDLSAVFIPIVTASPTPSRTPSPSPFPAAFFAVRFGELWRFADDGSDAGSAWRTAAFDDSRWKTGNTPAGTIQRWEAPPLRVTCEWS